MNIYMIGYFGRVRLTAFHKEMKIRFYQMSIVQYANVIIFVASFPMYTDIDLLTDCFKIIARLPNYRFIIWKDFLPLLTEFPFSDCFSTSEHLMVGKPTPKLLYDIWITRSSQNISQYCNSYLPFGFQKALYVSLALKGNLKILIICYIAMTVSSTCIYTE